MKKHITENDVFDLVYEKLNIANPNVNKLDEFARRLDLEWDEDKMMYKNPEFFTPKEFLNFKYKHINNKEESKYGFNEVISIIEEYCMTYLYQYCLQRIVV